MTALECQPLKSLKEVKDWKCEDITNDIKQSTISMRLKRHTNDQVPKTLVCHDMRGGYLEDRFVQGDVDEKSYNFYHWQLIDTFVYFSHNLITIPPVSWINAAHRSGVKILGTFITEWDDGYATCEHFLSSEASFKELADKMVTMTTFYNFDGWLINIENKIQEDKVSILCKFVEYLTTKLHEVRPESVVIWYDSVINTGELKWQDQLCDKNSMFFDICDGIFLNYCWNSEKLMNSKTSAMAKGRPFDVYVGIDVFGRGCLGDGGYNTIEALTAARQLNLSVAIFAQGWVYEKHGKDEFVDNENRFWDKLSDLCPTSVFGNSYLSTTFCLGAGKQVYLNGKVLLDKPWYNVGLQDIQPFYRRKQAVTHEPGQHNKCLDPCFDTVFLGGTCLLYKGELPVDGRPELFRLFDICIQCNEPYLISFTYRADEDVRIFLEIVGCQGEETKTIVCSSDAQESEQTQEFSNTHIQNGPKNDPKKKRLSDIILSPTPAKDALNNVYNMIDFPTESNYWQTRWFRLDVKESVMLSSVLCGISSKSTDIQSIYLGQIQMFPCSLLRVPTIENIQCKQRQDDLKSVSWNCNNQSDVSYYVIYQDNGKGLEYLGRSFINMYLLPESFVLEQSLTFGIQAVLNNGLVTNVILAKNS